MLCIGLTGGIGSGKTIVAKVFEILGIPVYYSDAEAKRIMNEDSTVKEQILAFFGEEAYSNNQINRPYISSIVFNNKEKLDLLNSIVHPATINDSDRWMHSQTTPYAIKEAALIFESGVNKYLNYVIGVSAPPLLRIQRVIIRDSISKEQVEHRIKSQMEETDKIQLCDFVIVNDEQRLVVPQVLDLHKKLIYLATEKNSG